MSEAVGKDLLLSNPIIPRKPPDFYFELNFIETAFTFVSTQSGDIFTQKITGNQFPESVKKFIRSAKSGQKIWIEDIQASGPDGNRKLSTVSIQIK